MPDAADQNLAKLLRAIEPLLDGRKATVQLVEQLVVSSGELENAGRAVIGMRSTQAGLSDLLDPERWTAFYQCLVVGLAAPDAERLDIANGNLLGNFHKLAAEEARKWVVFVPLNSPIDRVDRLTFDLSSLTVPACAVPPIGKGSPVLDEIAQNFGVHRPDLADAIDTPSLAVVVSGSAKRAREQALTRFADVRDAVRVASLLASRSPYHVDPGIASDSVRWVKLVLSPADGSPQETGHEEYADVMLGVDLAALSNVVHRKWHDRALRLLATQPAAPAKGSDDGSPAVRLARSIRVLSRTWAQSSFDVRYLLYLVALEALIPGQDDISEAVADLGARLLESGVPKRASTAVALKEAYDLRSRFMHDGALLSAAPPGRQSALKPAELQALVLKVWSALAQRYFDLADKGHTSSQLGQVLSDFRGRTRFKFGEPWTQAAASAVGK